MTKPRYIFVTGGVVSSLGKGIASASIGRLLVARGLSVGLQKFDPYINVDPGTMSPYQHGEVFVTEDGAETDLDLGHYERFTNTNTTRASNVTAGGIYNSVIRRERRGDYLGGTVQVVPHITDEIKQRIKLIADAQDVDFVITEIGGTVGDIESLPFLEALRQFRNQVGRELADGRLDLVGDVRDHLHGAAEVVALALLLDDRAIDLACGEVAVAAQGGVGEALVVAEVEIGLSAVVEHVNFAVLERVHCSGIDVEVGIELLENDPQPAQFEKGAEGSRRQAFA